MGREGKHAPRRPHLHHSHRFVPLDTRTKFAGRTGFAEFVSPALVDVAKPDVAAPSRLVAFSSPYHMRRIQGPGVPRTEHTFQTSSVELGQDSDSHMHISLQGVVCHCALFVVRTR